MSEGERRPDTERAAGGRGQADRVAGPTLSEAEALAVVASVDGIGPAMIDRLVARLGTPAGIIHAALGGAAVADLLAAGRDEREGGHRDLAREKAAALVSAARDAGPFLARIARMGIRPIAATDAAYPARLRGIAMPPAVLFVRGDVTALSGERQVAVVGTRRPTDGGRRTAARIAAALARAGATVVSGLATGIDGSAHAATVEHGGVTVAVIGSGHGRLFPAVHQRLAEAIVESGGAVISEHAPDTTPTRGTFPRRNRIISGLADAVVIVEAGARSGALVTGSWALEQGREVFVVPGSIEAPASAGCNGFLRDWPGLTRVVSGVPQLLDDLGLAASAAFPPDDRSRLAAGRRAGPSRVAGSSPAAALTVLDPLDRDAAVAILRGATTVDELAAVTAAPVGAILAALTRLEVGGLVVGDRGRYRPSDALAGGVHAGPRTPAGAGVAPAGG